MREIVLDTETTGLDPETGDRVVEIGCIELLNGLQTENSFHTYLNPERDMPDGAFQVHGLSTEFLSDKPLFADVAMDFLAFIGDDKLIIHNAEFDLKFVNFELRLLGLAPLSRIRVVDTLDMARRKFPGERASLDALCRRFGIDATSREKHGALVDAGLLCKVYVELTGGRQVGFDLAVAEAARTQIAARRAARDPRPHAPLPEELARHDAMLDLLNAPIWRR